MSELSFRVFCIEGYSKHTGKPGNELYDLFQREGLLALLKSDYEDLHGMGIEWLVNFFNGKSGNTLDPQGTATRAEVAAMLQRFISQ